MRGLEVALEGKLKIIVPFRRYWLSEHTEDRLIVLRTDMVTQILQHWFTLVAEMLRKFAL